MSAYNHVVQRLSVLAAVLLLAACAASPVRPYVAPGAAEPSARLIMRNRIESKSSYEIDLFDDAQGCAGARRVGTGNQAVDPKTTTVRADRLQTLQVLVSKPGVVCRVRESFTPTAGRSYVVSTSSLPAGCSMLVLDATNPDAMQIEPSLRRRDLGARLCVPIDQAQPIKPANGAAATDDATDLPTGTPMPAASPPAAITPPAKAPAVSDDDLRGLIGR